MKNKFIKDLRKGNEGEQILIDLLNSKGIECKSGDGRKHDVLLADGRAIECKYELYSAKSGNLAVEFWNSRSKIPSGITASQSEFWVFLLPCGQAWLSKTKELLAFFNENKGLRDVIGAGDGNADIRLYKKEKILSACFIRIDELPEEELKKIIGI